MDLDRTLTVLEDAATSVEVKMKMMTEILDASAAPDEKLKLFLDGTLNEYTSTLDDIISDHQKDALITIVMVLYMSASSSSDLKRMVLELLRNLSRSHENRYKLFKRDGLVNMLLECSKSEPVQTVKTFAIGTLNNLAIADEMAESLLKEKPEMIGILTTCATGADSIEDVREKAIKTIMNLAAAKANKVVLVQQHPDLVTALVECARTSNSSEKVRERATKAISNLCTDQNNRVALFDHPVLVDTLMENAKMGVSLSVRQIVLQTLFLLADSAQNKARMFQRPTLVDTLLDCIQHGETATSGIKEWAMVTLIVLMSVETHKVALFNKPMVIEILLACVNNDGEEMVKIKEWALGALMVLASAEENKVAMLDKPLLFESIAKNIEVKIEPTTTELAKEHAIGALFNLSLNATLVPQLYKQGHSLIYSLIEISTAKGESNKVKTRATDLLARLGIDIEQARWFLLVNTLSSGFDIPRLGRSAQYRVLTKDLIHNIANSLYPRPSTDTTTTNLVPEQN